MNTWLLFQALSSPFSLLVTFGAACGLGLVAWQSWEGKDFYLRAGLGSLLLSLIGARGGYVLVNLDYFLSQWREIPQVWLGGLSWPGGVAGGLIGLVLASVIAQHPMGKLLDAYLPLLATLALSIGLITLSLGVGYGPLSDAWWAVPVRDEFGVSQPRWPIGLVGNGLLAGAFFSLAFPLKSLAWMSVPGRRGSLGLLFLGGFAAVVSALRVDAGIFIQGLRWEAWAALMISLIGLCSFIWYARYAYDEQNEP